MDRFPHFGTIKGKFYYFVHHCVILQQKFYSLFFLAFPKQNIIQPTPLTFPRRWWHTRSAPLCCETVSASITFPNQPLRACFNIAGSLHCAKLAHSAEQLTASLSLSRSLFAQWVMVGCEQKQQLKVSKKMSSMGRHRCVINRRKISTFDRKCHANFCRVAFVFKGQITALASHSIVP